MKKRNLIAVLLLSFVTFGLYAYYWLYATGKELREESGRRDVNPGLDVILAVITLGAWGVWAGYRNAKIAHELLEEQGDDSRDHAIAVAAAGVASYFVGPWTWLVAIALLQEDYNALAEDAELDVYERPPPRARVVDVDPAPPPEAASRREDGAMVFTSNAPAPRAY